MIDRAYATVETEGIRTSKTVNGVTTTYYLNGSQIIAEQKEDGSCIFYLYDELGSPIGMQYHGATYGEDVWDVYWFETNLQGELAKTLDKRFCNAKSTECEYAQPSVPRRRQTTHEWTGACPIVAIYDKSGTKLISYRYDAWGNANISYHNGGASTTAVNNPFRYRGYYYNTTLNLYCVGTRYYDANIGRWISPDGMMSGVNGSLHGFNLYVYCFNNPIGFSDTSGNWPGWKNFWQGVGNAFHNFAKSLVTSIEMTVGIGFGMGFEILDTVTAEISRDTYVGVDDGVLVTGNIITAEAALLDSKMGIGDTYNHLTEKNGIRVSSSGTALDGPFDMIHYPDVTHGNQISFFGLSVNERGDILYAVSFSAHFFAGGRISVGFNISEFIERLRK